MPIAAVFEFPTEPIERYEKVLEIGGDDITSQPSRLSHVCYLTPGGGFTVVDVWESEEEFARFGPVIGAATAGAGLDAKPAIFPVHGTIGRDGSRNQAPSPEESTVARFYTAMTELWADGDVDRLDLVLSPDFAHHLPGMPTDREGLKMALLALRHALPDFEATIELLAASGDLVADAITWTATHSGELMGMPATGRRVTVTETHIARVVDGMIVERWGTWDQHGFLQQIGVVPAEV
jgi:predicted ester cyclase